ncbi:MAG TPA: hypothetical protein VIJ68_00515 [Candidatus Saccharimonadales bacterium]
MTQSASKPNALIGTPNRSGVFLFFMKHVNTKSKKQQDDRLLKRLSLKERRQQEELRRRILLDPLFQVV